MKAPTKLLLVGLFWARGACAEGLSFNAYLIEHAHTFVSLSDKNHSAWVEVGEFFGPYQVKEFRLTTEQVLLRAGQNDYLLPLGKIENKRVSKIDRFTDFLKNKKQITASEILTAFGPPSHRKKLTLDFEVEVKPGHGPITPVAGESWWVYLTERDGMISVGIYENRVVAVLYRNPQDKKGAGKNPFLWLPKPSTEPVEVSK